MTKSGETWTVTIAETTELPFALMFIGDNLPAPLDSLVLQGLSLRPTSGGCTASLSAYGLASNSARCSPGWQVRCLPRNST